MRRPASGWRATIAAQHRSPALSPASPPISLTRYLTAEQRAGHVSAALSLLIAVVARACKTTTVAAG